MRCFECGKKVSWFHTVCPYCDTCLDRESLLLDLYYIHKKIGDNVRIKDRDDILYYIIAHNQIVMNTIRVLFLAILLFLTGVLIVLEQQFANLIGDLDGIFTINMFYLYLGLLYITVRMYFEIIDLFLWPAPAEISEIEELVGKDTIKDVFD